VPSSLGAYLSNAPPLASRTVLVEWRYADPPGAHWRTIHRVPVESVVPMVTAASRSFGGGRPALFRAGGDAWFATGRLLRMLPEPRWTYSGESLAWSARRSWPEAWEECREPLWMLHAAARYVASGVLADAVVDLLEPALGLVPSDASLLPIFALASQVRGWANGRESAPSDGSVGATRRSADDLRRGGHEAAARVAAAVGRAATIPLASTGYEDVDGNLGAPATAAVAELASLPGWDSPAMADRVRARILLSALLTQLTGL
jgi:hypothetical protein